MQSEKVLDFLRKKGTLGVCTLGLVGAMAFASYKTSYPIEPDRGFVRVEESENETEEQNPEEKSVTGQNVIAENIKEDTTNGNIIDTELAEAEEQMMGNDTDGEIEELALNKDMQNDVQDASEDMNAMGEDDSEENDSLETAEANSMNIQAEIQPTVYFQDDSFLTWPAAGTILMDYNMNGTVYFKTLNQYKYNPALILGSDVGNPVVASAKGIINSIETDDETGVTLTMNIGNDYSLVYGQLKDITVSEGEVVEQGQILGYVSDPTKYYCEEGANLYFEMKKNGQSVDPMLYLES